MPESHTDQISAWIGPPDQTYITKISWTGVGVQIVGTVLTTISFFAFFYGGMKTFSSLGAKSSDIVPAGVQRSKSV